MKQFHGNERRNFALEYKLIFYSDRANTHAMHASSVTSILTFFFENAGWMSFFPNAKALMSNWQVENATTMIAEVPRIIRNRQFDL